MLYSRKKETHKRRNAIIAVVALFLLAMAFVPRWRHATACTLTGGRWTSRDILPYLETGCRVKSRTAGKACTGQLRDECDRVSCDLALKHAVAPGQAQASGTCPKYWIKNGYDERGKFLSY